jgi:hypothetical protein
MDPWSWFASVLSLPVIVIIKICRDGNWIFRMEAGEYRALRRGALPEEWRQTIDGQG